jgi:hypothetical protein
LSFFVSFLNDIIKNKPVYYSENKNVTVVSAEELVYNNLQTNDLAMPGRVLLKLKGFTKLKERGLITKIF